MAVMAKVSVLVVTLVVLHTTGVGALIWFGSGSSSRGSNSRHSSDSSSRDSSDQNVVSPNGCRWGRHRNTPGKPSARAMYLDGTGVVSGSKVQFTDGNSCVFSFLLDRASSFSSSLWNSVGNIAYRYRCTLYDSKTFKNSWKDCKFVDNSWSIGVDVDTSGTITYANGCKNVLNQWTSKPIFCRAYARCGPRGNATTTTTTRVTTTTTNTKAPTTTVIPPPVTTTPGANVVTGTTSEATTTCPPLKAKCVPEGNCTYPDKNYIGRAGLSYTLTFTLEGNPQPTIVEALAGSTDVMQYITNVSWIPGTVSTYLYTIEIPAVDFTVLGPWSVKGVNSINTLGPVSIEPAFTLALTPPIAPTIISSSSSSPYVQSVTTFYSGVTTIVGSIFQATSCSNIILYMGTEASPGDFSSYVVATLDPLKITLNPFSGSGSFQDADQPSYCSSISAQRPVWMALTWQTFQSTDAFGNNYRLNFFIQDHMTQPVDVVNDIPLVYFGLTVDDVGEGYVPTYTYFTWESGSTSPVTYWLYP